MDDKLETLITEIRQAFANAAKPNDENIIVGDDNHFAKCDECREARDYFWGRTRESISQDKEAFRQTINALSFFTPSAWYYYLPEYLIGCLQNNRLRVNVFWHHEEPIVKERFWSERIELLNAQQCAIIIAYLNFALKKYEDDFRKANDCQRIINWWREIYQNRFGNEFIYEPQN